MYHDDGVKLFGTFVSNETYVSIFLHHEINYNQVLRFYHITKNEPTLHNKKNKKTHILC